MTVLVPPLTRRNLLGSWKINYQQQSSIEHCIEIFLIEIL